MTDTYVELLEKIDDGLDAIGVHTLSYSPAVTASVDEGYYILTLAIDAIISPIAWEKLDLSNSPDDSSL